MSSLLRKEKQVKPKMPKSASVSGFVGEAPRGRRKPAPPPEPDDPDADHHFDAMDGALDAESDAAPAEPEEAPGLGPPLPPPLEQPPGGAAPAAGLDAAPPPPPPAIGGGYASRAAGDYRTLDVSGGCLHYSLALQQVNGHCGDPTHRTAGGGKYNIDRRLILKDGRRRRPIGLIMAWLGTPCETKLQHDRSKGDLAQDSDETFKRRREGRELLENMARSDTPQGLAAREILDMEGDREAGELRKVH